MKMKLLVPIISGVFLLITTIITIVFSNNSSIQPSNITVQLNPEIDNSANIDEVENLTINQY